MRQSQKIAPSGWKLDNSYASLPGLFFTNLEPTPVHSPKLVILNSLLANYLGLDADLLQSKEGVAILAGNKVPEGSIPIAQAYAGHQFGYFTKLGDGRALLIGEQITPKGEKFDIQLKGSGPTPYSRGGDGRASLGPMLREYIISEAMHALGIPTTRSLAVVTTGESIIRETQLPGAILTRVASSHLRVGTFQYIANFGTVEELTTLADYTLKRHVPDNSHGVVTDDSIRDNPYLFLLKEVVKRQAVLIAKWQLVGFIHGVMNTDNVSIAGETINYGPCAFMDHYNPKTVFSSIDAQGRYAFGNQPLIAEWNLARFAETLLPLLHEDKEQAVKLANDAVSDFAIIYENNWLAGMREKLGIFNQESGDKLLIEELLNIMNINCADYTNTFLALTFNKFEDSAMYDTEDFTKWNHQWQERLKRQKQSKDSIYELMKNSNPALIPRNYWVEEALQAAVKHGDYGTMHRFLEALSKPFAHTEEQAFYSTPTGILGANYRTFCGT